MFSNRNLIIIILLLLVAIAVALFIGKSNLDAQKTVDIYIEAGLKGNADVAKGTPIESDVQDFVNKINATSKSNMNKLFGLSAFGMSKEDIDQILKINDELVNRADIKTELVSQDNGKAIVRVLIISVDRKDFQQTFNQELADKKDEIRSEMNKNITVFTVGQFAAPYIMEALKTAAQKAHLTDTPKTVDINCIFNQEKNKWEIENINILRSNIGAVKCVLN